jgi:hypothetical protein
MATDPWKDGRITSLLCELQQAGATPLCTVRSGVLRAHGETLHIDAANYCDAELNAVLQLVGVSATLSMTIQLVADPVESLALLTRFCAQLRSLLLENAVAPGSVSLQLAAAQVSPQAAWLVRRSELAAGPLTFTVCERTSRAAWLQLWHLRSNPEVGTIVRAEVCSPCPLLASETADTVLPDLGIAVPAGSAWLPLRVDLERFCNVRGEIHAAALRRAIIACVEIGDALLDEVCWRGSRARHDAWFNRRLAIELDGIAAVVGLRGLEPGSFAGLQDLAALVTEVRAEMHDASKQLAKQCGALPALRQQESSVETARGGCADDWRMRWQRTLQSIAVRHRTLLVINPWELLSPAEKAEFGHLDLLPLAAMADAVCFRRKIAITHWNINEFKEFHSRLGAVLGRKYRSGEFAQPL